MQRRGVQINDDAGLEREADVMAKRVENEGKGEGLIAQELTDVVQQNDGAQRKSRQLQEQLKPNPDKETPAKIIQAQNPQAIQLETNPLGNFATYDTSDLQIVSRNLQGNPTEAKVLNSGRQGPASAPQDPGGWDDLTQNYEEMIGVSHPPRRTQYKLDLNQDQDQHHKYTRMHAVNSFLAQNSNLSGNIFSGRQSYNKKHEQRAEAFAKGFMDDQSWQQVAGNTLGNTLNDTDQIGKSAGDQLYYKSGANNTFPDAFIDTDVQIVGNDDMNYPGINVDKLNDVCVMEYDVRPIYGLALATVKNSIENTVNNHLYQNLNLEDNQDGTHGNLEGINTNGILNTAAQALVNTYATSMTVDIINWIFDPNAIDNNAEVATDAVPWKAYPVRPLIKIKPDPPEPGAKVTFKYSKTSFFKRRIVTSNPPAFDI